MQPETFFRALADPTRLRALLLLAAEGELCVCELTHALRLSQPKISRHLAMLRDLGIVATRREGQWVLYSIHPELPEWAIRLLKAAVGELDALLLREERRRLRTMRNRPQPAGERRIPALQ